MVEKTSLRKILLGLILVASGLAAGLLIASEFGLSPFGQAREGTISAPSALPLPPSSGQEGQPFVEVARAATPAVVNVSWEKVTRGREGTPMTPFLEDPFFRRFFGDEFFRQFDIPRERREASLGSGVIVDEKGYIVTNNHVVERATELKAEIKVLLSDKREFKGKVVGTDPKTDVAVVKIDATGLPTIPWGDSSTLQVGEYVLAIGNPFGLNQTVTMGIVSAVGRQSLPGEQVAEYEDFIQTDAAINPGNSGGALVNVRGELVGINTAIFTRSGGYMGIGFAIPSTMVRSVMESLVKTGKVVRGWLGVQIQEVNPQLAKKFGLKDHKGALVSDVVSNSPAEKAGMERGDVIIAYNGKTVENAAHLRNMVAQTPVGSRVEVKVIREGKEKGLTVTVGELTKEVARAGEEQVTTENALSGVVVEEVTPETARRLGLPRGEKGVVVAGIEPDSVAEQAGLQEGDVILEINREPVRTTKDYRRIVTGIKKDEALLLLIRREGSTFFLTMTP